MLTPYSWLTSFIFAAQDYNEHSCFFDAPPGVGCSRKKANEAFIFLALYVCFSIFPPTNLFLLHRSAQTPPTPLRPV